MGARLHGQIGAVREPPLQHAMLHRIPRWNRRCQARGGMTDDVNPRRSHDDSIDPHPALRAGLSLPGRGVFSLPCNCDVQTVTPLHQATSTPLPRPGQGEGEDGR